MLCKPRVLGDDELIEIMDHAKRPQWDIKMLENEKASYNFETYKEIKEYFKQLEAAQDVRAAINETSSRAKSEAKKNRGRADSTGESLRGHKYKSAKKRAKHANKGDTPTCKHCGKPHKSETCWNLPQNADKRPKNFKPAGGGASKYSGAMTKEEVFAIMRAFTKQQEAAKEKKKGGSNGKRKRDVEDDALLENFAAKLSVDKDDEEDSIYETLDGIEEGSIDSDETESVKGKPTERINMVQFISKNDTHDDNMSIPQLVDRERRERM